MSNIEGSKVSSFYSGKSVFITGGTGFLGKTLIEKLLYSCSGIDKIYVLVRDKGGKQARDRIERITNSPAFNRLKASRNEDLKKITIVAGDISRKNLGLPDDILKCLENEVSVVFHLAATVSFTLPLKDALQINVNGTQEVIQLCHRMKKLQAFVHVSTAYSNSDRQEIDEVVYSMPVSLETARDVAEIFSDNYDIISQFMGNKPNTYTFTKAFAELLVMKQCKDLPTAIVRPSIVISSLKEPCPGWIDTWTGCSGMIVGYSAGVLKVAKGVGSNVTDLVPVDMVTNMVIVAATECQKSKETKVYNCCSGASNPITCNEVRDYAKKAISKYSLNQFPLLLFVLTPNVLLYTLITFTLQIIPAFLIDFWCVITGKKTGQLKTQRNLKNLVEAMKFFLVNEWTFFDNNVKNLIAVTSPEDKTIFNFDMRTINWETCIENYVLGAQKFLLKR